MVHTDTWCETDPDDIHKYIHTYIHTYRQTDRQTDIQTDGDIVTTQSAAPNREGVNILISFKTHNTSETNPIAALPKGRSW